MKFMITWRIHEGKIHEAYSLFFKMTSEQDAADRGARVKQIGRWHDLARGRGVVICECDSAEALANWALQLGRREHENYYVRCKVWGFRVNQERPVAR